MKSILFLFLITLQLIAKDMPIYFIGTFNENNSMLKKHYISKLDGIKDDGWALTKDTEKLLKNDFKSLVSKENINLLTAKDFDENIKEIVDTSNVNIKDRKIAFLNLDSNHREFYDRGTKKIELTLNLTFIQIGEEKNRNTDHNSFEVRYSSGVSYINRVYQSNQKINKSIYHLYKKAFREALKKLLNNINNDKSRKNTSFGLSKNDLFFTIKSFKIGKKAQVLVDKVFEDKDIAQNVLMTMYQESLIKKIRENGKLDNVVLFYPSKLNKKIFKNWKRYLKKLNEVSESYKDSNARIVIRDIKPLCKDVKEKRRYRYFEGYYIKALLSSLKEKKTEESDSVHSLAITSRALSQVTIPLEDNLSLDALSSRTKRLKKLRLFIGQHSEGFLVANTLNTRRKSVILDTISKSIDKLATDAVNGIKEVNELRKNNLSFKLKYLCEE